MMGNSRIRVLERRAARLRRKIDNVRVFEVDAGGGRIEYKTPDVEKHSPEPDMCFDELEIEIVEDDTVIEETDNSSPASLEN